MQESAGGCGKKRNLGITYIDPLGRNRDRSLKIGPRMAACAMLLKSAVNHQQADIVHVRMLLEFRYIRE